MASKRIKFLNSLVVKNIVYDLCCDHGLIGELALDQDKEVIFVDIVAPITEKLDLRLRNKYSNYSISTCSILDLVEIKDNSSIILAGIGSKLLSDFLSKYSHQFNETHQIIICGHSNQHLTIEAMNQSKLTRVNDFIIEDASRYYEIYECQKLENFTENLTINKEFPKIKDSTYHKQQLNFFKYKQSDILAKSLYSQLLEI